MCEGRIVVIVEEDRSGTKYWQKEEERLNFFSQKPRIVLIYISLLYIDYLFLIGNIQ